MAIDSEAFSENEPRERTIGGEVAAYFERAVTEHVAEDYGASTSDRDSITQAEFKQHVREQTEWTLPFVASTLELWVNYYVNAGAYDRIGMIGSGYQGPEGILEEIVRLCSERGFPLPTRAIPMGLRIHIADSDDRGLQAFVPRIVNEQDATIQLWPVVEPDPAATDSAE